MRTDRPTLLLDEIKCKKNIHRMVEKAGIHNLIFRPHFKTHQSAVIGEWFREAGVSRITVSSVTMAEYFANAGWKDILIAFPANILEIDRINKLAAKINLSLTLESIETADYLHQNLKHEAGVYLKIDTGYHRTGIPSHNVEEIRAVLKRVQSIPNLNFTGLLTHAGNNYHAKSRDEIILIHHDSISNLNDLKRRFKNETTNPIISIGDTPSCSIASDFTGVDEIRPGNFIFYDVMQCQLGSCNFKDIAVVMACPVVAKHPERNEIVIYGGAVHLSKEYIVDKENKRTYGMVVSIDQVGWSDPIDNTYVSAISQEHGIIKTTKAFIDKTKVGDILGILPVHSCLTAHQMKEYLTINGKRLPKMN
jgi:D-serine deaminase-like pyridoxal phosphate-dependent protein